MSKFCVTKDGKKHLIFSESLKEFALISLDQISEYDSYNEYVEIENYNKEEVELVSESKFEIVFYHPMQQKIESINVEMAEPTVVINPAAVSELAKDLTDEIDKGH